MPPRDTPLWRDEFSVHEAEQQYVTRRQLTKFLVLTSLGMFVGNLWLLLRSWRYREPYYPLKQLAMTTDLEIGESKVVNYPTDRDPCLLLRLGPDRWVCYAQKCTHLSCAVYYQAEERRLYCPCHHGSFAPETGAVLAGPPPRPLPRIRLSVERDGIFAHGVDLQTEGAE